MRISDWSADVCSSDLHGPVLDIVEVVLHPVLHIFDSVRLAAEAVHLCPAGDAGFHASARHVGLDDRGILLVVIDRVRAGTDQAHFATQYVDQLRQLIATGLAQPVADTGEPWVAAP